jgi:hypothetical protein
MKTDLRKALDSYRAKAGELRVLDLPPMRYLMVDGRGDPDTAPAYADALAALYPVAYRVKFAAKAAGHDYVVPPLEALWWADDPAAFTSRRDKTQWRWTVMLLVPDWVDDATVAAEVADPVRVETLAEGRCVQTLHVGPYDDEGPVLAEMHDRFIPDAGLAMTGRHHEIYLNDARRTAPERLRTILRQPVVTG